ncbi:hypothetical protein HDU93_008390 [Gonapodya sp. JEL0774]|nr:hypothetical protein HDU93_008390 [Gonapodya sp. JEL0774]
MSDDQLTHIIASVFDSSSSATFSSAPQIVDALVDLGVADVIDWKTWRARVLEVLKKGDSFIMMEGRWKENGGPMRAGRPPTMWQLSEIGRAKYAAEVAVRESAPQAADVADGERSGAVVEESVANVSSIQVEDKSGDEGLVPFPTSV